MSDTILTAEYIADYHRMHKSSQNRVVDISLQEHVALCDSHEALRQQVATLTEERDEAREARAIWRNESKILAHEKDALNERYFKAKAEMADVSEMASALRAERDKAIDSVVELNERCDVLFRERDALREELAKVVVASRDAAGAVSTADRLGFGRGCLGRRRVDIA